LSTLQILGLNATEVFKALDENGDGDISKEEFIGYFDDMQKSEKDLSIKSELNFSKLDELLYLRVVFQASDEDGEGHISREGLEAMITSMGRTCSKEQFDHIETIVGDETTGAYCIAAVKLREPPRLTVWLCVQGT
jgi:Ca2+-binding EF-hand superfamily protein